MKTFNTILLILLFIVSAQGQNSTFNNAGGDNLWSNLDNWTDSLPTAIAFLRADVILDSDQTVQRIEVPGAEDEDVTISGSGTLTLTGGDSNNGNAIRVQSNTGVSLNIETQVVLNNSGGASNFSTKNILSNTLRFGSNSTLTLMSQVKVKNFGGTNTATVFNGTILGTGTLTCNNNNSNILFGETADNSNFEGTLTVFITDLISNTTVPGGFLSQPSILLCNADGGSLELNGENSMEGNISRKGENPFTYTINANQNNVGYLRLQEGIINLDLNPSVTELHFAPSNQFGWDSLGTVNITNFQNGIIRFGEADTTLTAHQLSLINIGGDAVELSPDGFLQIASPNSAPVVSNIIMDMVQPENFGVTMIDLTNHFSDPNGDELTYTLTSSDESVATVAVAGDMLSITEVGTGTTMITVTADDNISGSATEDFMFTIEEVNAINEVAPISGLSILPNVTRDGQLAISFDHPIREGELLIYNAFGALVQKRNIASESNFSMEMKATAPGLYFVLVQDFEKGAASTVQIIRM